MQTGPHNILGLEINEFAAELARVTVWIGDIQWCRRNGYPHAINPILKPLDGIEHRDALLNPDGSEAEWPTADVIVGNPPFLGDKVMRGELGADYVETLRKTLTTAASPAAPISSPTGSRKRGPRSQPENCKPPASLPPTPFAAAPTARCWNGSLRRRAFSKRGATKNGSTKAPPCAFRLLDLGRFFRLTVAIGWMGWKWRRFMPI